jgi:gliding motility-associated-like protein
MLLNWLNPLKLEAQGCFTKTELSQEARTNLSLLFQEWSKKEVGQRANHEEFTIPVVFHLIEPSSAISDAQVSGLINNLNEIFSNFGGSVDGFWGVDTRIRFCLAKTAPDGAVTSGVTRMISDYHRFDMDLETPKLQTMVQWDPRHYLNIWVVSFIDSEVISHYSGRTWWRRIPAAGFASVPGGPIQSENFGDGIVISKLSPLLLAHECGHYLGLLHTFEGGCTNNDCLTDGDMVCDTPPDKSTLESCGDNSCNTDILSNYSNQTFFSDTVDMGTNIMDYGNSECRRDFTKGQAERMLFTLQSFRSELYNQEKEPCRLPCDQDISFSFEVDKQYPLPGELITFNGTGRGVDTYEWFVEKLGGTKADYSTAMLSGYLPAGKVLGDSSSFEFTFEEIGKYRVYAKAYNRDNPKCFVSQQRIIRVTCGVDARYYPNKRIIASKRPTQLMFDSVKFTNRSYGSDQYHWNIKHSSYNADPDLPPFQSNATDITYKFAEPGDYFISLIAQKDQCYDTAKTFVLPVVDPTIDGEPQFVDCIPCMQENTYLFRYIIYNHGYDTVNVGMPLSFYSQNPLFAVEGPELLNTIELTQKVYGFDSLEYESVISVPEEVNEEVWLTFNDPGAASFPLEFPPSDLNVYSFNTQFPPSEYAELNYLNNLLRLPITPVNFDFPDVFACKNEELQFISKIPGDSVHWYSFGFGNLGFKEILDYRARTNDTIVVSKNYSPACDIADTFLITISQPAVQVEEDTFAVRPGENVQFFASGGEDFRWSPVTGLSNPFIHNPSASPREETLYIVESSDSLGCTGLDSVMVFMKSDALIPELFTPNGDGRNDRLQFYGLSNLKSFELKIYNRNGNVVYKASNKAEAQRGWDGTWRGTEQPTGVYFWQFNGQYYDEEPLSSNGGITGAVYLVR